MSGSRLSLNEERPRSRGPSLIEQVVDLREQVVEASRRALGHRRSSSSVAQDPNIALLSIGSRTVSSPVLSSPKLGNVFTFDVTHATNPQPTDSTSMTSSVFLNMSPQTPTLKQSPKLDIVVNSKKVEAKAPKTPPHGKCPDQGERNSGVAVKGEDKDGRDEEGDGRHVELGGEVGLAELVEQVVEKAKRRGFRFNLLCVGEGGIGKTTLIHSLFDIHPHSYTLVDTPISDTPRLRSHIYELCNSGVSLNLGVEETVGFGDEIGKEKWVAELGSLLDSRYEDYLQEELKVQSQSWRGVEGGAQGSIPIFTLHYLSTSFSMYSIPEVKRNLDSVDDTRIHALLYFINPSGLAYEEFLKALDRAVLAEVSGRVNLVPVIAKADIVNKEELIALKNKIKSELNDLNIQVYRFPEGDAAGENAQKELRAKWPFAVAGSTELEERNGILRRVRNYPWGSLEVENPEHCDFVALRTALIELNMEDLGAVTETYYESYRRQRLLGMTSNSETRKEDGMELEEEHINALELKYEFQLSRKDQEIRNQMAQTRKNVENVRAKRAECAKQLENVHREIEAFKRALENAPQNQKRSW